MGTATPVCVDDDFAPREARVAVRSADDELARRVDMELDVVAEKGLYGRAHARLDPRDENVLDVLLDLREHRGLGVEIVVLGRKDDGLDSLGRIVIGVLNGHLGLRIGAEVRHRARRFAANGCELAEEPVGKLERKRHEVLRFPRRITKHHPLIARSLFFGLRAFDPLVDVARLFVDGAEDAA